MHIFKFPNVLSGTQFSCAFLIVKYNILHLIPIRAVQMITKYLYYLRECGTCLIHLVEEKMELYTLSHFH